MIVCDVCKRPEVIPSSCILAVRKLELKLRDKKIGKKPKPRDIIKIPMALCEECIDRVCQRLGTLTHGRLLGELLDGTIPKLPRQTAAERAEANRVIEETSRIIRELAEKPELSEEIAAMDELDAIAGIERELENT